MESLTPFEPSVVLYDQMLAAVSLTSVLLAFAAGADPGAR